MSILVTGAAGFIGFHVAKALLERGERVVGVDNLNCMVSHRGGLLPNDHDGLT